MEVLRPIAKLFEVYPQDGNQTVTISTSSQTKNFKIPANESINFANSILAFDVLTTALSAGQYGWYFMDAPPVSRVKLTTSQGVILADVSNVNILSKFYRPMVTSKSEFMGRSPCWAGDTVAGSFGYSSYFQPSGGAYDASVGANTPNAQYIDSQGAISGTAMSASKGQFVDGFSQQHLMRGTAASATGWRVRIRLEDLLPSSILSNNDFLAFDHELLLEIQFVTSSEVGFYGTDASNPATGTAAISDVTLSNLFLHLMKDVNLETSEPRKNKAKSGYTIQVPWIESRSDTTSTATTYSYQLNILKGYAYRLLRVLTAFANNTTTGIRTANIPNVNGQVIKTYQQKFNTASVENQFVSVQESGTNGANYWDWVEKQLTGSAVMNRRAFEVNFCIFLNLTSSGQSTDWRSSDHKEESGMVIGSETNYRVDVTKVGSALKVYQFPIYQKKLHISSTAIQWE